MNAEPAELVPAAPSPVESSAPTTVATPSPAKIEPPAVTPPKAHTHRNPIVEVMTSLATAIVSASSFVDRSPWPK